MTDDHKSEELKKFLNGIESYNLDCNLAEMAWKQGLRSRAPGTQAEADDVKGAKRALPGAAERPQEVVTKKKANGPRAFFSFSPLRRA